MSFKAEVIADNTGKWCANGARFATKAETERYVSDLAGRWTAVTDWRATPSDDPITHVIHNNTLYTLEEYNALDVAQAP